MLPAASAPRCPALDPSTFGFEWVTAAQFMRDMKVIQRGNGSAGDDPAYRAGSGTPSG